MASWPSAPLRVINSQQTGLQLGHEIGVRKAVSGVFKGVLLTEKITVRSVAGEKYDRIVSYKLGPMPEPVPQDVLEFYEEEIPF